MRQFAIGLFDDLCCRFVVVGFPVVVVGVLVADSAQRCRAFFVAGA